MNDRFYRLPLNTKLILLIQCLAMLMGASTHFQWAMENGFLSENYNASLFSMIFWDALTFIDPIAAFLILWRPKYGVYAVAAIMLFDVTHNCIVHFDEIYSSLVNVDKNYEDNHVLLWFLYYWMIWGQILFALFVFVTFKGNLRAIHSKNA